MVSLGKTARPCLHLGKGHLGEVARGAHDKMKPVFNYTVGILLSLYSTSSVRKIISFISTM